MRILIDQHRDCFNFATRKVKDQKRSATEGRRGQKKGANGEKSRERNVTQVGGGGFGDGGKDVGMKLEDSWRLVLNKKNFTKVICLKKTIRSLPYPLYIVDGWLYTSSTLNHKGI